MPTAVVTGGAGFLGSHLVALLLEEGFHVIAVDSLWTGSVENVSRLGKHPKFTFLRHNVTEPFPKSLEKADQVYGDPLVCPQPEEYWGNVNPFGGRSCYDEGKRVAEALAYGYRLERNVDVRIGRIFNAYGPGIRPDDGRVVPNFIAAALRGKDIIITGDGTASRCFQYAGDCAIGLYKLMESSVLSPVNIGREEETTIGEMARLINDIVAKRTGRPEVRIVYGPKLDDDPYKRVPNTRKAKRELGHEAKIGLREGLKQTVDWFLSLPEFNLKQKAKL
ncbi:UDP-glucuronic acid decarboxylase 1 [Colletotrichum tanaceti]|uniref:UDP-glucuronate decarboxylase n=1 Tax=Colletotrichum tanaceti TaxID=1306861 RepID=A0A4U6X9Y1_9PEZI|nr:UDP-glucuronic acid decarboxylase 1 [Colletotrichum tanaceti]TKW52468.1 UDP-glucuronic acid decarboxylase 1 [Colletotrichum tanaceti]